MPKCKLCKQPYQKANHVRASCYCNSCKGIIANQNIQRRYRARMRKLGRKVKDAWEEKSWVRLESMWKGYFGTT